jgi:hypothetical protein
VICRGTARTTIVPTDAQLAGDFSGGRVIRDPATAQPFLNNRIPARRLDANSLILLQEYYPRPTPGFQLGALNYTSSAADTTDFRSGLGELNYNISPTLSLAGHYNIDSSRTGTPFGANDFPHTAGFGSARIFYTASGNLTWSIRPNLLYQLTTAYYHGSIGSNTSPSAAPRSRNPRFTVRGYFNTATDSSEIGGNADRESKTQNDNSPNNNGTFAFNGSVTGDALADLLLGESSRYTESFTHRIGTSEFRNFGFYTQDRWRLHPRLSLTYGVRYEYYEPERDCSNTMSYFDPSRFDFSRAANGQPNGQIVTGTESFGNGIVIVGKNAPFGYALTNSVRNTFAPRLGLAYAVIDDKLTLIRAGYGVFHDRWPVYALQARRNYPFNDSVSSLNTSFSNPTQGSVRLFPIALTSFSSPWDIPYMQKWSFDVQRQFPRNFIIDVGYVATRGAHFVPTRGINQPLPSAAVARGQVSPNAVRPYPGFASISTYETNGNTSYHSLQVSADKRFSGASLCKPLTPIAKRWTT